MAKRRKRKKISTEKKISPEQLEVAEIKKLYYKELHAAQARYRYYMKRPDHAKYSLAFEEALQTGGQFSFAGAQDVGDIYSELGRIRQFVSLDRNAANMNKIRVEVQVKRANQVLSFFEPDITMEERVKRGLNEDIAKQLWEVYRKLEEEAPGLIQYGGIMSSEQFISLLYNEMLEGATPEEAQARGHERIESMKYENPNFIKEIPINSFMASKKYAKYRSAMTEEEMTMFEMFKMLDKDTKRKLLGGDYDL